MPKFMVHGTVVVSVGIVVEVEDQDFVDHYDDVDDITELEEYDRECILYEIAHKEFGGITNYAGNGGCDKLIGVRGSNESLDCCNEIEWKGTEKYDE